MSLISALFALVGITDLFAAMLPIEVGTLYWGSQAPVRTAFFFALTVWAYMGGPKGLTFLRNTGTGLAKPVEDDVVLGGMGDGFIYAWAFVEAITWFWVSQGLASARGLCESHLKGELTLRYIDLYHTQRRAKGDGNAYDCTTRARGQPMMQELSVTA